MQTVTTLLFVWVVLIRRVVCPEVTQKHEHTIVGPQQAQHFGGKPETSRDISGVCVRC